MIDGIKITPLLDGFDIQLPGELGAILNIVDQKSKSPGTAVSGRSHSVVAQATSQRDRTNDKRPAELTAGRSFLVVAGVGFAQGPTLNEIKINA
ncbi:hypothetical protein [Tateyamaria sp.]|uniref:hypothetical protein n=1 Tax=Tateyamaria sp. TaxID=1929288 RepID=UPI00329EA663